MVNTTIIRMDREDIEEQYAYSPSIGDVLITWHPPYTAMGWSDGVKEWFTAANAAEAMYNWAESHDIESILLWNGNYLVGIAL